MKSSNILIASLVIAAAGSAAAAGGGGSLEMDRAYASELKADADARSVLNQGNQSNLEVSVGVIFGYKMNHRDGAILGDDDTAIGFAFSEVEVAVEGDVTDNMRARVSMQFGPDNARSTGSSGVAQLEDAYVDWQVNDSLTLRVGQFVPSFSAEASTSEFHMMNAHRAVSHEFIATPSWAQGIEAQFGGDTWGVAVGFTDGQNTGNTAYSSTNEFDYAVNARFDLYSDSDKARFDDQTSWRGSEAGWRAGVGVFFGSTGSTNPSVTVDTDWLTYTLDATYEGDGWSVRAAFYGNDIESTILATDPSNMGFEVGGSVYLSDQWEAFGRWDVLILDDSSGAGQTFSEDVFHFVTLGTNYYFVPESHAAKLTFECGVSLDNTNDIITSNGNLDTNPFGGSTGFFKENDPADGQLMFSGTLQWLF